MANMKDISGKRFGMLTALYPTGEKTSRGSYFWHCKCDCGNEKDIPSGDLLSGHTGSCGCRSLAVLDGLTFGKLKVLHVTGRSSSAGGRYWLCQCECGRLREVTTHDLRSEHGIRSCISCAEKAKKDNREKFTQATLVEQTNVRRERLHGIWQAMKTRCNNTNSKEYQYYGARDIRVCSSWNESYQTFKTWALANGYDDSLTIERKDVDGDYSPDNCKWIPMRQQFFNKRRTHYIFYKGKKISLAKMVYDLGLDYGQLIYYLKSYKPSS